MKQKLKSLRHFLFAGMAIAIALSCSKEVYEDSPHEASTEGLKIRHIKFGEFKSNSQAYEKYALYEQTKQRKATSRMIEDTVYNYIINTDQGKYIEDGAYNSYTFPVSKADISPDSKIENVLFSLNNSGEYDTYLVKYDFTPEELLNFSEEDLNSHEVNYTYIGEDGKAAVLICVDIYREECGPPREGNNDGGSIDPECTWVLQSSTCGFAGGGGGPDEGNPGTGTGTGGGGGGNPSTPPQPPCHGGGCPPIITTPVMDEAPIDNCEELKKLLKVPTYPVVAPNKTVPKSIAYLQGRLSGFNPPSNEEGFNFRNDARSYADAVPYADTSPTSVIYSDDPDVYGGTHIHLESLYGMFSHEDIGTLHNFATHYNYNGQAPDYSIPVHVLVTKNKTYALKIDNWSRFNVVMRAIYNNETKKRTFKRNLEKTYQNLRKTNGTSQTDYELAFLNYLKEQHIFASLYRLTTPAESEEKQNWEKLTIGGTISSPIVLKNPCN